MEQMARRQDSQDPMGDKKHINRVAPLLDDDLMEKTANLPSK